MTGDLVVVVVVTSEGGLEECPCSSIGGEEGSHSGMHLALAYVEIGSFGA